MGTRAGRLAPAIVMSAAVLLASVAASQCLVTFPVRAQPVGAADSLRGGGADPVQQVLAAFTPEARRYARAQQILSFAEPFYVALAAGVLLFSGIAAGMRDVAVGLSPFRYVQTLIFVALLVTADLVLGFPLAFYRDYVLEHQFGLSTQSFAAWFGDSAKSELVNWLALGVVPVVYGTYGALRRSPRRWWLWLAVGSLPLLILIVLADPILIRPLYNKFTPLEDRAFGARIVALAEKAGIPGRKVYQVDRSRQTRKINAYVNGFGASQRIVLWDTTLEQMDEDEILFVMGHEMGHYVLGHIWKGTVGYWLLLVVLFFVLNRVLAGALARFGARWKVHEVTDLAALPLAVATLTLYLFLASPLINGYRRLEEHEADVFGLEVTHSNQAAARAFVKLGRQNLSDPQPHPLVELWLYSHPPLLQRVRFALEYRPWEQGQPARLYPGKP